MKLWSIIFALPWSFFAVHGQLVPIVCSVTANLTALSGYNLSDNPNDIHFWFYPTDGSPRKEIIYNNSISLDSSGFKQNNVTKTVFLIHGFTDNSTVHLDAVVLPAYLNTTLNYGYIVPDWGLLSGNTPFTNEAQMLAVYALVVCQSVPIVVQRITQFINWLALDPSKLHIIGHSLGAHTAGNVGDQYQQTNGNKSVARITGLDPAGPLYFTNFPFPKINAANADFVDIIHTNMGLLGDASVDGDVDFFPNGGVNQPGCTLASDVNSNDSSACSHQYAPILYAASITKSFPAYPCLTLSTDAVTGLITTTPLKGLALFLCQISCQPAYLGENCDPATTGCYYLTTTNPP